MSLLDPTLDVVFKLLFVRNPELLEDMLTCVLGRPVGTPTILDPSIPGQRVRDKRSILDIRVSLPDRSRAGVEMQRRDSPMLAERFVYYNSRNHADQLRQGENYELLRPTTSILWTVEPLLPHLHQLHSVFELRDVNTHTTFSDHTSIHLLQLSKRSPQLSLREARSCDYAAQVERWAHFFTARSPAELHRLASENRIMRRAKHALEQISRDPHAQHQARIRSDEIAFYHMDLAASRREGQAEGRREGQAEGRREGQAEGRREGQAEGRREGQTSILLKLLTLRFGPPSEATRAQVAAASAAQLDAWAGRVLDAPSLHDVLAP